MSISAFSVRTLNQPIPGVIEQEDSAEGPLNRPARTYAKQIEALRKYRTGGEQKVTVEHVNISAGGQAIIGNVETGGRGYEKR